MKRICAALCGLLCFSSHGLQASGLRLYSQIQTDWTTTYSGGNPRLEGLFKKLKDLNAIGAVPGAGQVSGGGWDDEDETPAPTPTKTTFVFPVYTFSGDDYRNLLQTSSDLAILQLKIDDFVGFGPEGDATSTDPVRAQLTINEMKHAIEVERAVIALGFYLQSPNLAGKCRNADDMKALQKVLLLKSPDFIQIGTSWNAYKKSVIDGLQTVLAAIPPSICNLRTVVNKAQTNEWLAQAIDAVVDQTMKTQFEEYTQVIQANQDELGRKWSDSETDVSLRPLFSVQRGFQNAIDILNLVQRDASGLIGTLNTLNEKAGSLKNSRPASIDRVEADLRTFRGEVNKFMLLLKALPTSPGLASLSSCQQIDTNGPFLAMQRPMQDCLGQLIDVYKQTVTTAKKPDAATENFARLLNQIMSIHLKKWE